MRRILRRAVRRAANMLGYSISRLSGEQSGRNTFSDITTLTGSNSPIIFDVGANVGETIKLFKEHMPHSIIHAFEPSDDTFKVLQGATSGMSNIHYNNFALGRNTDELILHKSSLSGMTSLLNPGKDYWGEVVERIPVLVSTLDDYCFNRDIQSIDILKLDTQGFDLEVLRGAKRLLEGGKIHILLIEIIFNDIYEGQSLPEEIFSFLRKWGFRLVAFYGCHMKDGYASWTDALFIHSGSASLGKQPNT